MAKKRRSKYAPSGSGDLEALAAIVSGMAAEPVAGIGGILAAAMANDSNKGSMAIENIREALTYAPRTPEGQASLRGVSETMAPITDALESANKYLGDKAFEATGSPLAGAAGATAIEALMSIPFLGPGRAIPKDYPSVPSQFKQSGMISGRFTPEQKKLADEQGIKYRDFTVNDIEYSEVLDPSATPKAEGWTMGERYPHKIQQVRPELAETAVSPDSTLMSGTGWHSPGTGKIGLPVADLNALDFAQTFSPEKMGSAESILRETLSHEGGHVATKGRGMPVGGSPEIGGVERKQLAMDKLMTERSNIKGSPEYKQYQKQQYDKRRAEQPGHINPMIAERNAQVAAMSDADSKFLSDIALKGDDIRDLSDFESYQRLQDEWMQRAGAQREVDAASMTDDMTDDMIQGYFDDLPLMDPAGIMPESLIQKFGSDDVSMAAKKPPMSRVEAEQAGLWHPLGKTRLNKSIDEHSRVVANDPNIPESFEPDWDELIRNKTTLLSATGDRSQYGGQITEAGGIPLKNPVGLEGGADFMKRPDASWASKKGRVSTIQKRIKETQEAGRDPVMAYTAMSHDPTDFNRMMSDTFFEMMQSSPISKSRMEKFNRAMRKRDPRWQGMDDPTSEALFHNVGEVRKNFMDIAGQAEFKNFFPDRNEARFAVTDPKFMNVPVGQSGQAMSHPTGNILEDPVVGHKTYDTMLEAGRGYQGGIEGGMPSEDFWRDWTKARRDAGKDPNRDPRSMDLGGAMQDVDAAYVEGLMNRKEQLRQEALDPGNLYLSSPKQRRAQVGRHGAALPENILRDIDVTGGTSVEMFTGQKPGREGFMVASEPNTNTGLNAILQNATEADLAKYIEANKEFYSQPGTKMGAWKQGEDLYVEPTRQIMDFQEAMNFGKKTDQIAGFDLNRYPEFEKTMGAKFPEQGIEFDIVPDPAAQAAAKRKQAIEWLFGNQQR